MKLESWRLATIIICVALLIGGGGDALIRMGSLGYPSGYEGVRASFSGIEFNAGDSSGKSDLSGMSFYFDADDPQRYAPNLVGEMTNAFVPEGSVRPSWVFPELWTGVEYIKNPVSAPYEWNLPNPDDPDETIAYVMEEWLLRMYVSITAEWDDVGSWITSKYEAEWGGNTRYTNTKIWIELDISPIQYFEGADQVYFGLAKVVTSDVAKGKLGTTEEDYTPTDPFSVNPSSGTSYRYLYHSKYGTTQFTPTDPKTYKGRVLNPEIFGDKMFFHIDLVNFGTQYWTEWLSGNRKGDAVTWGFDVHVFVVGEWRVKDIEEIPEDYGRDPMTQYGWSYYLARFLADPKGQFWLIVGVFALIFLFCVVACPWVLVALFGMIGAFGGKKK